MPTLDWLRKEFDYGYDSGDIDSLIPDKVRKSEEEKIGGSYRRFLRKGLCPYFSKDSQVLELGPGGGSWSRPVLRRLTEGRLTTVDFQDVAKWLKPEESKGRVVCHQVADFSFECLKGCEFDFFFSVGVLCHNNKEDIGEIFKNTLEYMKPGAVAIHQYSDWPKLTDYGWEKGAIPVEFQDRPDEEIWWPRNSAEEMEAIAREAGWKVHSADTGFFGRDSVIHMEA